MRDDVTPKNLARSRTGFRDAAGTWYALDNAGTIMPAVSDSVSTSLFRVSAVLDEDIDPAVMQRALERVSRRFPYFHVELRKGLFWYYLVPCRDRPRLVPDGSSPCQDYDIRRRGTCLFRVRMTGPRVACEFSHALSDGTGCVRFLKNLVVEYLRLRYASAPALGSDPGRAASPIPVGTDPRRPAGEASKGSVPGDPDLCDLDGEVPAEEYEDAYSRYVTKEYPSPDRLTRAFHLRSAQLPRYQYRATYGILPLDATLALAKRKGLSLTELLAAAYLDAFQSVWMSAPQTRRARQRPRIAVEIPVNMRKFYPTATNRNFSLFVLVTQDMRLGPRNFDEIAERVHHELRFETDPRNIARQIKRNVGGAWHPLVRLTPLVVKNFLARVVFSALGDDLVSGFVSNLGPISLPPEYAAHVLRFDAVPTPSALNKTNAAVLSYQDRLYISFGSLAESREIERCFYTRLRSLGLSVHVECAL